MPNSNFEDLSLRPDFSPVPIDSREKLDELVIDATRAACERTAKTILTARFCGCHVDPDLVEILALAIRAERLRMMKLQRGWLHLHGRCPSLGSQPELSS